MLLVVLMALASESARADGFAPISLQSQTSAATATMNGQRAVLWHKGDRRWEITIQVEYGGDPDQFAWVVPFPAMFTVKEGDSGLMDQLDRLTAPFIAIYYQSAESADVSMGDVNAGPTTSSVQVWQSGTIGPLGYDVVTATAPSDLLAWLSANGYRIPEDLDARLAAFIDQGYVFFCGRIDKGAVTTSGFSPVTFVFDDLANPTYPMELTALSTDSPLRLTLWVVSPSEAWLPANYDAFEEDGTDCTQSNLVTCLAQHLDAVEQTARGRGFSTRFLGRFTESSLVGGLITGRLPDNALSGSYYGDVQFPVPAGYAALAKALQCVAAQKTLDACATETSGAGLAGVATMYLDADVVTRLDGNIAPGAMRDVLLVQQNAYEGVSNLWTRVVH